MADLVASDPLGERERAALQAVAHQMAQAPEPVTVALIYANQATEEIAELLLEHGVAVVLILPFGPLTRRKAAHTLAKNRSAPWAMISIAAPEVHWSRSILTQSMVLLRIGASGVLMSDPEPEWLNSRVAHAWAERPMSYLRYGSLPDDIRQRLNDLGARPISRRADTGEPNLGRFFTTPTAPKLDRQENSDQTQDHFHFRLTSETAQQLRDLATAIERTQNPKGNINITVPCGPETEDLRAELRRFVADDNEAASSSTDYAPR